MCSSRACSETQNATISKVQFTSWGTLELLTLEFLESMSPKGSWQFGKPLDGNSGLKSRESPLRFAVGGLPGAHELPETPTLPKSAVRAIASAASTQEGRGGQRNAVAGWASLALEMGETPGLQPARNSLFQREK